MLTGASAKPAAGLRRGGMNMLKGGHWTAQQMMCVIVCACVSTGSHRVQQEEGRSGLVTERSDVPSMRRLGNYVGNPQCLLVNLDWKRLSLGVEIQFAANPTILYSQHISHADYVSHTNI